MPQIDATPDARKPPPPGQGAGGKEGGGIEEEEEEGGGGGGGGRPARPALESLRVARWLVHYHNRILVPRQDRNPFTYTSADPRRHRSSARTRADISLFLPPRSSRFIPSASSP